MEGVRRVDRLADIKVVGVGGAGGNAVVRMAEVGLKGVEFVVVNTDAQALGVIETEKQLQIGEAITSGLGSGGDPQVGQESAEENRKEVEEILDRPDMVFITAGLGGGTGTGAAPVIAQVAKEIGALTVAVVSKPFTFEGPRRNEVAIGGAEALTGAVDALITIPNDKLLSIVEKRTTIIDAFNVADDVLRQAVQGISDLITSSGHINVDFADVKAVLRDAGTALMGIGLGSGENRAAEAAQGAISSPLLESSIEGARNVLFNITGSSNMLLSEIDEAAQIITQAIDSREANIIWGLVFDDEMAEQVRITVVATGFGEPTRAEPRVPRFQPGQSEQEVGTVPESPTAEDIDDINVPTFLREKKK